MRDGLWVKMLTHSAECFVERGLTVGQAALLVIHLSVAQGQLNLVGGCLDQVGVFSAEMIRFRMREGENSQHC